MKTKIIKKESDGHVVDYQTMVIDEIERLGGFRMDDIKTPKAIGMTGNHANSEMFAVTGLIQQILHDAGYFFAGYLKNCMLGFNLKDETSWQDVYNILYKIDRIEVES